MHESQQQRYRTPWAEQARDNGYMQELQMQHASFKKRPFDSDLEFRPPTRMQRASFGNSKKRPIDSDLEFRPPTLTTLMQHASFGNNKMRPIDSNLEFQLAKQRQHFSFGNNKRRPFASNL